MKCMYVNNTLLWSVGFQMATLARMADSVIRQVIVKLEETPRGYSVRDYTCIEKL